MVFVVLGTQKNQFTRMLEMVDDLVKAGAVNEPVIAQIGYTEYETKNFQCFRMVDEADFQKYISEASVVISHSGSGALFSAIKQGKKIIAVARLKEYGEMIDEEGYILDGTRSILEAWGKLPGFNPRPFDFTNTIVGVISNWIDNNLIK